MKLYIPLSLLQNSGEKLDLKTRTSTKIETNIHNDI